MSTDMRLVILKSSVALGALVACGICGAAYGDGTQGENGRIETIVVTGTHIPRPQSQQPNAMQEVTADDMARSGVTNLTDYLSSVPSLSASLTQVQTTAEEFNVNSDGYAITGMNLLNLRGMGYNRTLTLVDGHRHVAGSVGMDAVDINAIPVSLIDHVDISSGDVSAIYGAGGAAGVVNFVMKHNLDGLHANVQGGMTEAGGGNTLLASASYGLNTGDKRGNLTLTLEHYREGHVGHTSRDFSGKDYEAPYINSDGTYSLEKNVTQTGVTAFGNIYINDVVQKTYGYYRADGTAIDTGTTYDGWYSKGGDNIALADKRFGDLVPAINRTIAEVNGKYDVADYLKVSAEFKYARVNTASQSTPPNFANEDLYADNAYLSASASHTIKASFESLYREYMNDYYQKMSSVDETDPQYRIYQAIYNRYKTLYNGDGNYYYYYGGLFGSLSGLRRKETTARDTYRGVLDIAGDFPDIAVISDLHYDVTYTYGKTDIDDVQHRNIILSQFEDAIDAVVDSATGDAVCRSRDSGCVPYNPFDQTTDQSESIAGFAKNTHMHGHVTQHDVTTTISGSIPRTQVLFAGPLEFAMGAEYRFEKSDAVNDAASVNNLTYTSAPRDEHGSYSATEGFFEATLPLLKDKPFARNLSLDGAVRQSSHTSASDTTSWKFGGNWNPTNWLQLRGNEAFSVRSPNLSEIYSTGYASLGAVADPCSGANAAKSQTRKANCEAFINASSDGNVLDSTGMNFVKYVAGTTIIPVSMPNAYIYGNTKLHPESSRTLSAGFSVRIPSIPDFSASMDWYRIKMKNVIGLQSVNTILNDCVDRSSIDNASCAAISRVYGVISVVRLEENNGYSRETSGVDFAADYRIDTANAVVGNVGTFDVRLNGNYLAKLKRSDFSEYKPGTMYNPMWHLNFDVAWIYEKWNIDYTIDYFSRTTPTSEYLWNPEDYGLNYKFDAKFENNVQIGYVLGDAYRAYFGVKNLTDQKPSNVLPIYPIDPQGRTFYLGIKVDTDSLSKISNQL